MRAWTRRVWEHDLAWSLRRSPVTVVAAALTLLCIAGALFAPWIAPQNPFDPASLNLNEAFHRPGSPGYPLGSDDQGRDLFSTILYGARISLGVGLAAVLLALVLGVSLGLISGYVGGRLDAFIMRVADVQLSFPAILIALLVDGVARVSLPNDMAGSIAIPVLILSIGVSGWVQYARTVRGLTLVEREKEYVQAARVIGRRPLAIITEATLSFLGVGVPPTQPSLGTLIRVGNDFLFSGEWWITLFPGCALVILVLSINLLGDWLRDALNPKLR